MIAAPEFRMLYKYMTLERASYAELTKSLSRFYVSEARIDTKQQRACIYTLYRYVPCSIFHILSDKLKNIIPQAWFFMSTRIFLKKPAQSVKAV
jgi:hypothetical protein